MLMNSVAYVDPRIYDTRIAVYMKSSISVTAVVFVRMMPRGVSFIQVNEMYVTLGTTVSSFHDRYSLVEQQVST